MPIEQRGVDTIPEEWGSPLLEELGGAYRASNGRRDFADTT